MKNAVLLNAARNKSRNKARKPRDGRRGPGTAKQRAYRALVKKHGSVTKAAREWRRRGGRAAANVSRQKLLSTSSGWKAAHKRGTKKARGKIASGLRGAGFPAAFVRSVESGLAAWNPRVGRNARRNPAFAALASQAVSVEGLKVGVPVVLSGILGYFVPNYVAARYPKLSRGLPNYAIGAGTVIVTGAVTAFVTKSGLAGAAAATSALAGYLIPKVGPPLITKLLPMPAAVAGLGQNDVETAIERGIEEALREAGLSQAPAAEEAIVAAEEVLEMGQIVSEEEIAEAPLLGQIISAEEAEGATELLASPSGEFGLGRRGAF